MNKERREQVAEAVDNGLCLAGGAAGVGASVFTVMAVGLSAINPVIGFGLCLASFFGPMVVGAKAGSMAGEAIRGSDKK